MSMLLCSFPLSQSTSSHFWSSSSLPCPMGIASKQLCRCLAAGQGQCTTRGEAALGCGSGAGQGRCHTGKLSSSASDSSRVRQESEKQCPCHNSCIIKKIQCTGRQQILYIHQERPIFKTTPKPHDLNRLFNGMQNTNTREVTWSNALFGSLRQTGHPNLKSKKRAAEKEKVIRETRIVTAASLKVES